MANSVFQLNLRPMIQIIIVISRRYNKGAAKEYIWQGHSVECYILHEVMFVIVCLVVSVLWIESLVNRAIKTPLVASSRLACQSLGKPVIERHRTALVLPARGHTIDALLNPNRLQC